MVDCFSKKRFVQHEGDVLSKGLELDKDLLPLVIVVRRGLDVYRPRRR